MLRRLGCHPYGLDGTTARLVTRTMCDEISISNSEIWQLALDEPTIEAQLNVIYRRCLGAEAKTTMSAVRHESAVVAQRLRADAQALKFRNNILGLDDDHVVKRVYLGLRDERAAGAGVRKNGAKYLEQLAQTAGYRWQGHVYEKDAAKKEAKEYVSPGRMARLKTTCGRSRRCPSWPRSPMATAAA